MPEDKAHNLEASLRKIIETFDVAVALTDPLKISIENTLRLTAAELNSDEASVLIRDGRDGDLRFLTAVGEVAGQLENIKVPAGKGIAGFVFSSGQPMAVADVGAEQSFYADVDRRTGYSTQTILATPLSYGGEVTGVLEYVNRKGAPPFAPFTVEEMDRAAFFAEVIGALVNAYESADLFGDFAAKVLSGEENGPAGDFRRWLGERGDAPGHRDMLDLAVLVREIASRGAAERQLCRELLRSLAAFLDNRDETSFLSL